MAAPAFAQSAPPGSDAGAPLAGDAGDAGAKPEGDAARAEARSRFERGLSLYRDGAYDAALAEFLRSRELFSTRAATQNAGSALKRLGRFDEALDMFDRLLAE